MPDAVPAEGALTTGPSHPIALFFHWFFKVCAVVWYVLCTHISDSFVINFVVSMVLLAMDFWTVKNVTGRLMVGMRWWNEADDSGSAWRFECAPETTRYVYPREKKLFWAGLFAGAGVWVAFTVASFITFNWEYLIIPIIGMLLGGCNLYGYFKCSKDGGAQLQQMGTSFMTGAITRMAASQVTNRV